MNEDEPNPDHVAQFLVEKSLADDVESYLSRGRRFRELNETELLRQYVEGMRQWASAPRTQSNELVKDTTAEYQLRGIQPPSDIVKDHMAALQRDTSRAMEQLSEERKIEISNDLFDEYLAGKKGQH